MSEVKNPIAVITMENGPIRFDFFWGFGDDAGAAAGRQKSRVEAWMLVPNGLEPRDLRR